MASLTLQRAITETKFRFSLIVLFLGALIIFGSFYIISYLQFSVERQKLFTSAMMYRAEYMMRQKNVGFFPALQATFLDSVLPTTNNTSALGVPVLTYHSIIKPGGVDADRTISTFEGSNVSLDNFKDQMFALKAAGWQTVPYEDFEKFVRGEKELSEKSFLLTFDDGAKNSFYPVDPILNALGYSAVTFILPSHSLGNNSTYYLNKDEVEFMLSTGRWTVQSHGNNIHTSIPTRADGILTDNALSNRMWLMEQGRLETHEEYALRIQEDLKTAQSSLEEAFDIPVTGFAFPFGDYGQNASNDPDAQATVIDAAKQAYSLAFYQNWNRGNFTFNYPNPESFLIKRIPVRPDWSGEDLLAVLGAASPKSFPYDESPHAQSGWESDWGTATIESDGLHLTAASSTTGALAILDGTYTWENYEVEVSLQWESDYVMLLFNLQSEQIGRACVFSDDGTVQLQERTAEDIYILRESKRPNVKSGEHTIGAISSGTTTICTFDGEEVINATLPASSGGLGIEAWAPEPGAAHAIVKRVSAKEFVW